MTGGAAVHVDHLSRDSCSLHEHLLQAGVGMLSQGPTRDRHVNFANTYLVAGSRIDEYLHYGLTNPISSKIPSDSFSP